MDRTSKPFPTLGQRLAAAIISYQLGRPTVDGTLKQYVGGNLDPWWGRESHVDLQRSNKKQRYSPAGSLRREPLTHANW
jgi:hypothetical protein